MKQHNKTFIGLLQSFMERSKFKMELGVKKKKDRNHFSSISNPSVINF
jgi:hypothetical protein